LLSTSAWFNWNLAQSKSDRRLPDERHAPEDPRPVASHRRVVSDSDPVPGNPGSRAGRCVRPPDLSSGPDFRTRLICLTRWRVPMQLEWIRGASKRPAATAMLVCAALACSATADSAAAATRTAFDGSWNLTFVTRAGSCDPTYDFS